MQRTNRSDVTEFILIGLTTDPALRIPLFLLMFLVYIFTLIGNSSILVIVSSSTRLHKPMYFFLAQLSFLDITFSSSITPKMLVDLLSKRKTISFNGCVTQLYFFSACAGTEFFLLGAMAYDRYVAICNPLLYTVTMTQHFCVILIAGLYVAGFLHSLIHAGCLFRLHFCGPNVMNHFACDYPMLLKLSCTSVAINDLMRFILTGFIVLFSLFVTVVSYYHIVNAILRIRTTTGRRRAASTCISHFICVILYFVSCFSMEVIPNSSSMEEQYKGVAVIPTVIIPGLNPLIYSLRNQEFKEALKSILNQATHSKLIKL